MKKPKNPYTVDNGIGIKGVENNLVFHPTRNRIYVAIVQNTLSVDKTKKEKCVPLLTDGYMVDGKIGCIEYRFWWYGVLRKEG